MTADRPAFGSGDIPHVTAELIAKYAADLKGLGLLCRPAASGVLVVMTFVQAMLGGMGDRALYVPFGVGAGRVVLVVASVYCGVSGAVNVWRPGPSVVTLPGSRISARVPGGMSTVSRSRPPSMYHELRIGP
ncbi:MAG: hypothetical protein QOI78_521 [Actinomycetota bacterium]|nr:hypothetical protein [Actinomycetota bacterium]